MSTITAAVGGMRYRLLKAFEDGERLTADEAMRKSAVPERSCYWKRISELVEGGFLIPTGDHREAELGKEQRVVRITERGRKALTA